MNIRDTYAKVNGFTIIEILVVIAVIGILAGVTAVGYNGYQERAIRSTMKSDLSDSADRLEVYAARNNNEYPHEGDEISTLELARSGDNYLDYYTNSEDASADGKARDFCLQVGNSKTEDFYHISGTSEGIQNGECDDFLAAITPPPPPPPPPTPPTPPTPPSCDEYNRGQVLPNNGGTIVYKASAPRDWGCYLVAAGPTTHGTGWWGTGQNTSGFSESRYKWGCRGTSMGTVINSTNNRIGDGKENTRKIMSQCSGTHAARKAASYRGGGFTDWYLPNRTEMTHLINYNNSNNAQHSSENNPSLFVSRGTQPSLNKLGLKQGGGWISGSYWSSSETSAYGAWGFSTYGFSWPFEGGYWEEVNKNCSGCWDNMMFVRPVRTF